MATTVHEPPRALPPAEPPRPRTLLVGTGYAIVACVMFFAGLFGIYFQLRTSTLNSGSEWIPAGTIPLPPGGMMMVTMAMSVVTMQWAVYAIARDDRVRAYLALALTMLFGIAVINQTAYLYNQMGLGITDTVPAVLIYVITGAHIAMLVAAMIFIALMAFRALAGQFSSRQTDGIVAAAMFWYATVAIYAVIYYGIYITK
jgi:heme/copper-type cytochrome/quinol oxidase subunit 3